MTCQSWITLFYDTPCIIYYYYFIRHFCFPQYTFTKYRVSQEKATIEIQSSVVIQTTYCSSLKSVIAFIYMEDEEKLSF